MTEKRWPMVVGGWRTLGQDIGAVGERPSTFVELIMQLQIADFDGRGAMADDRKRWPMLDGRWPTLVQYLDVVGERSTAIGQCLRADFKQLANKIPPAIAFAEKYL